MPNNNIKIYLVGYPKSGTTWLIKLMSHVLRIPVGKKKELQSLPPAVEINDRLNLVDSDSCIIKAHELPADFYQRVDKNPKRILYIYRDFKAVFISAFFYFKVPKRFTYLFLLKNDSKRPLYQQLLRFLLYPFSRLILSQTLKDYKQNGVTDSKVGTWNQHLKAWKTVAEANKKSCLFAFVSYEDLISDPDDSIKRILKSLNLPNISDQWIKKAIKEESFDQMKSRLNANSNPIDISKLRTGKTDDWKNYLSEYNLLQIEKSNII